MMRANGKIRSLYLYTLQCENTFAREMQMEMESICGICVLSFHRLSIFGIGIDSIILKKRQLAIKTTEVQVSIPHQQTAIHHHQQQLQDVAQASPVP